MKYTLNASFVGMFEEKLKSFQKKFDKYGVGKIHYTVGEERAVFNNGRNEIVVDIDVDAFYKINDYDFVASLEFDENLEENLIKKVSEDVVVPKQFRTRTCCDHCGINRRRTHTVLLHNNNTDEYIQVGKACLKDYTGVNIGNYAQYLSFFDNMEDYVAEITKEHWGSAKKAYEFDNIVLQTLEYVKRFGYISKRQSYDTDADATSTSVWHAINHDRDFYGDVICEEYEISAESKNTLVEVRNFLDTVDEDTDYVHNLKMLSKTPYIDGNNFGLVVSAVGYYLRSMAKKKASEKANKVVSKYIGNEGDKVEFTATPTCVFSTDTQFGMMFIYKFDVNGDVVVWKTSKALDDVEITVKGTVKSTNEYKGEKQTEVTRCRIIT